MVKNKTTFYTYKFYVSRIHTKTTRNSLTIQGLNSEEEKKQYFTSILVSRVSQHSDCILSVTLFSKH